MLKERFDEKLDKIIPVASIILAIVLILLVGLQFLREILFKNNIKIEGVEVSFLTPIKAREEVQKKLNEKNVVFQIQDKRYTFKYSDLNITVFLEDIEKCFEIQKEQNEKSFKLGQFDVDYELLKQYLNGLDELDKNNPKPENAKIFMNSDGLYSIENEKYGNYIDFAKALNYAYSEIKSGNDIIDFTFLMEVNPEILSTNEDLNNIVDTINMQLESSISYTLLDGTVVTLDKSWIENYISFDKKFYPIFDKEACIKDFLIKLQEEIDIHSKEFQFKATELDSSITLKVGGGKKAELNVESEKVRILEQLLKGGTVEFNPIYLNNITYNKNQYVELDITRQKIWFYKDGECLLDSECITGCKNNKHDTPQGIFPLLNKDRNACLKGYKPDGTLEYKTEVKYWMRFYQGCGLHDASWRSENQFNPKTYISSGSHGCVNLREADAKIIFENIDKDVSIIIYES